MHKVFFIIFLNNLLTLQLYILQVEKDLIICLLFFNLKCVNCMHLFFFSQQGRKTDGAVNAFAVNVSMKRKYRYANKKRENI